MRNYEIPVLEVTYFTAEDVILTSPGNGNGEGEGGVDWED